MSCKHESKSSQGGGIKESIEEFHLKNRTVFLWDEVNDASARLLIDRLLYLDSQGNDEIKLIINSPGGRNTSGMAILDILQSLKSPVSTICLGLAASFGALILAVGTKGKRFAHPRSRIMIHQPHVMGSMEAPASDIQIFAKSIQHDREIIEQILSDATGRSMEQIRKDADRDLWLSAQEAVDYGLVDSLFPGTTSLSS